MNKRFRWYLAASLLWMLVIFLFSAQPGDDSSEMSGMVVKLLNVLFQGNQLWVSHASFIVRKCAHMSEYAVLSMLFLQMYRSTKYDHKALSLAILCSFLYACSDEAHQLFVEGRAGMLQDVLIDTAGACIGVCMCYIVSKLWTKQKRASQ